MSPRRAAAVDIGSTSVHLLVGRAVSDGGLEPIVDLSEMLGLGRPGRGARVSSVRPPGRARPDPGRVRRERPGGWRCEVGRTGGHRPAPACRRCRPGVPSRSSRRPACPVHVLDQDEEGALTLLGVSHDGWRGELAVIDVGGGSTEIVQAGPDGIRAIVGLPLGASRLSAAVGVDDPPTADQVVALRREADRILATAPDLELGEVIAVGGTTYGVARVATGPGNGERIVDAEGIALAVVDLGPRALGPGRRAVRAQPAPRPDPAGRARRSSLRSPLATGSSAIRATELGIREGLVRAVLGDPDRLARSARPCRRFDRRLEGRDRPAECAPEGETRRRSATGRRPSASAGRPRARGTRGSG